VRVLLADVFHEAFGEPARPDLPRDLVLDEVRELVNGHAVVGQGRPKTESSFGVRSRISVSPTASPKASTLLIALEGTRCTSTERRNGPQLATSGEAAALARLVRMYSRSPEDTSVSTFVSVTSIGPPWAGLDAGFEGGAQPERPSAPASAEA